MYLVTLLSLERSTLVFVKLLNTMLVIRVKQLNLLTTVTYQLNLNGKKRMRKIALLQPSNHQKVSFLQRVRQE
jgi:hypothetical protein